MPVYEYQCEKCGRKFDEFVHSFDSEVRCPHCGGRGKRSYSGKMYSSTGKASGGCDGNCSTCGGCSSRNA